MSLDKFVKPSTGDRSAYYLEYYKQKRANIRARREATYAERQAAAFASGRFIYFLSCPVCGMGKPLKRHDRADTKFVDLNPDHPILQKRYGGGRNMGWFTKKDESLTLQDLKDSDDPEHQAIYANLRKCILDLAALVK